MEPRELLSPRGGDGAHLEPTIPVAIFGIERWDVESSLNRYEVLPAEFEPTAEFACGDRIDALHLN